MRHSRRLLCSAVFTFLGCLPLASSEIPIDGRVRDSGGVGLPGIRVELRPILSSYEQGLRDLAGQTVEPAVRTVTGAEGRFELLAPGEGMWEVGVFGEGFVPRRFPLTPLTAAETLPPVTLKRDAGLRVRVEGPDGRPLAGARVVGRIPGGEDRVATSGADGVARLACSRDEMLVLLATAPGFPVQEGPEVRGPAEVTFRLAAGIPRPVKIPDGAILRDLQTSLVLSEVITTGESWLLLETADGVRVRFESSSKLEVPAPAPLPGRVIDTSTRQPIAGGWVWPADDPGRFVRTDEQGGYRIQPSSSLRLAAAGHIPEILDESIPRQPGSLPPVALDPGQASMPEQEEEAAGRHSLPLDGEEVLTARVVDPEGRPVARAEVWAGMEELPVAVTGPDGSFTLRSSRWKPLHLTVCGPGFIPLGLFLPRFFPEETLVATVQPGATLTGRVTGADGLPVSGSYVNAELFGDPSKLPPHECEGRGWNETDEAGRFRITGLEPGLYSVDYRERMVLAAGESREIAIQEREERKMGAALSGRLLDAEGLPVSGAVVTLRDSEYIRGASSRTDADGNYRLTFEKPGLKIDKSSLGVTRHGQTLVLAGWSSWEGPEVLEREGRYDIILKPGPKYGTSAGEQPVEPGRVSTIAGRILGLAPEELARVKVIAKPSSGYAYWTAASVDPLGSYRLEGLAPDGWSIRAEAADRTLFETVHIPEGEALISRDLVFEPVAEVYGTIETPEQEPIPGAVVHLRHDVAELQTRRPVAETRTRSDGSYSIRLPEGRYEVTASKDGFVASPEASWNVVTVRDGKGGEATIWLQPAIVLRGLLLGLPAEEHDVEIKATRVDGEPGFYREPLKGKMTAEGRYEIPGLGPGTWKVEVSERPGSYDLLATGQVVIPEEATEATLDLAFSARTNTD